MQAEEQLLAIEAAMTPHMKPADRAQAVDRLRRHASRATRRRVSAAEALATLPIPVVIEPPKEVKP